MYKYAKAVMAVLVIASVSGVSFAAPMETKKPPSLDALLQTVASESGNVAFTAAVALEYARRDHENSLIVACQELFALKTRDKNADFRLMAQIKALGFLGDSEAARYLLKHTTYYDDYLIDARRGRKRDYYPCVDALILIGKPASTLAIPMHAIEKDEKTKELLKYLILEIEGKEDGELLIEHFAKKAPQQGRP